MKQKSWYWCPLCPCCQAMTAAEMTLPHVCSAGGVSTVSAPGRLTVSCCACWAWRCSLLWGSAGGHGDATPGSSLCTTTSLLRDAFTLVCCTEGFAAQQGPGVTGTLPYSHLLALPSPWFSFCCQAMEFPG